ncbi:MAG: hypothetical protein Q4B03_04560 [Lachnospiraceae bacterium]|nr:hypothetical protein [Lachnospiraceae bacterium]
MNRRVRIAEIMHIVPEEKDAFLDRLINPDEETQQFMWIHGIRRQYFYEMGGDMILYVFGYQGDNFKKDMEALTTIMAAKDILIAKRRRDVPIHELTTTNWWAPLKKAGSNLFDNPLPDDVDETEIEAMLSQVTDRVSVGTFDFAYDEDDWSESSHF